ncbi:TIR domain-containing protein [Actinokineospora fastidiosa]|uniref:TIR domain-containing protein n=1 Tax=Actinokineospora fastidiosa TaxID=1816 RepID=A0A918L8G5_9PSEU|nr:TIR domain-containing protein [Actinokineospora fastidiosa]GGS19850.1 hypothetical protein GCM10010171_10570 [Actinokineospora fastidiosa]
MRRPADYDAFLSYSYAVDRPLAAAVQRGLHTLARHWYQARALRVFRDQTSLSANPDLWDSIETALRASRHFILMASPEAAASPWVRREVAHWQAEGTRETFHIVLTSGEIVWGDGDFDWERTTALPPGLRGWFAAEPQWVNLGWARADTQLSLLNGRFRDEVATLAAAVHGLPKDVFDGEDVRRHRRSVRLRRAAVSGLALLTVLTTLLGLLAWRQQNTTERQRDQAVARELATRAAELGDRDPRLARLLSLAAWRIAPLPETRAGLLAAAGRPGRAVIESPGATAVAVSPDGRLIAVGGGSVRLWDTATRRPVGEPFAAGDVRTLGFSADGGRLVVGSDEVRVYDVATRTAVGSPAPLPEGLPGVGTLRTVAISPDGATIAVGETFGDLGLWDVETGTRLFAPFETVPPHIPSAAPVAAFSPDGKTLAALNPHDGKLRFWDLATGRPRGAPVAAYPRQTTALAWPSLAYRPDGMRIATAGVDGVVRVWDPATGKSVGAPLTGGGRTRQEKELPSVAFSADGALLAAGNADGTVSLWRGDTLEPVGDPLAGHGGVVGAVAFGPGGLLVSAGADGTVRLWDVDARLRRVTPLPADTGPLYSVAWSPDGATIAAGGHGAAGLGARGAPVSCRIDGWALCLALEGRSVMVGGGTSAHPYTRWSDPGGHDGTLLLWDAATRRRLPNPAEGRSAIANSVVFGLDGRVVFATGVGADLDTRGTVTRWSAAQQVPIGIASVELSGPAWASALSPDGRLLAVGGDNTGTADGPRTDPVVLIDPVDGRRVASFPEAGAVYAVAFSPDGRTLAAATETGAVGLWDVRSRTRTGELAGHSGPAGAVAYAPDGATVATAGADGTIRLWDSETGEQVGVPLRGHGGTVFSVAFSPDGTLLASGGGDNSVRLWEVASRRQVNERFWGHALPVRSVAFSPDGRTLASAGLDRAVRLWDVGHTVDPAAALCAQAGGSLTEEEWDQHIPDIGHRPVC